MMKRRRKREHPEHWLGVLWTRRGPTRAVTCDRMVGSGQTAAGEAAGEAAGGGDLVNMLQIWWLTEETPPLRHIRCQRDGTKPGNRDDCQEMVSKHTAGREVFFKILVNVFRLSEPPVRAFQDNGAIY